MEYTQKAKNFVYKAAKVAAGTALGLELLFASSCGPVQVKEPVKQEAKVEYSTLTPEKQKEYLRTELNKLMVDGKVETSELPALLTIMKQAKGTHQEIFTDAEKARDAYLAENPVKVFYACAVRQGQNMDWYFIDNKKAQLEVKDLNQMATELGVSLDTLLERMQTASFPGRLPSADWKQKDFNKYNNFLYEETVLVKSSRHGKITQFIPEAGWHGLMDREEHESLVAKDKIVNAVIYTVAGEKKEEPKPAQPAQPAQPAGAQPAQPAAAQPAQPAGAQPAQPAQPAKIK